MANAVYRKKVEVLDCQTLSLTGPPISVGIDRGGWSDYFDLWFEHVEGAEPRDYVIYTLGTGHPAPWQSNGLERTAYRFIGTVIYPSLVWHVYLYIPEVIEAWKQSIAAMTAGTVEKAGLPSMLEQAEKITRAGEDGGVTL